MLIIIIIITLIRITYNNEIIKCIEDKNKVLALKQNENNAEQRKCVKNL